MSSCAASTDLDDVNPGRLLRSDEFTRFPSLRYFMLYGSFVRISLIRELAFRTNFLVRLFTHLLWFALTLAFFEVIFQHTPAIGDWDRYRYLVFLGTFVAMNATVNTFFIGGYVELPELIRTGSLDFALLKPVDEQFLLTCRRFDWALAPQILFGLGVARYGAFRLGLTVDSASVVIYLLLVAFGVAILSSLLLMLAAVSFWTVQHRELFELWFLLLQLGNYPDDIYRRNSLGGAVGIVFTYVLPIVLAVNVPAKFGAMLLSGWAPVIMLFAVAAMTLVISRLFFRIALEHYRSAGS